MGGLSRLVHRMEGPDAEGFYTTHFEPGSFNALYGPILSRVEGDQARIRIETGPSRANVMGNVHGGFLLAFLDQVLFVGPVTLGRLGFPNWAVTLTVATQFVGAGRADLPLDSMVEIVSETGRLMFLRGQMEQEGRVLFTFQATLRKVRLGD